MHKLLSSIAASACLVLPCLAGTVSYTFKGVTTQNTQNDAPTGAITTEFPVGTPWTLQVEWDSAATPLFQDPTQCQYRLTKLTVTLDGVSGKWTTSSLTDKASFTLGKYAGGALHELQFTSGANAADHTNQTIANWKTYSANIVLSDPTGTAITSFTPVPTTVDMMAWTPNVANTHFKLYVTNAGATEFKAIFGKIQSVSSSFSPEISVQLKGKELKDGKSKKDFGSVPEGTKSVATTFTIRNTGDSTLSGLKLTKSDSHKRDFIVGPLSKTSLAPGAKATFKVSFKPKAKGTRKAKLDIASNDADENPFSIGLTGTGK